MPRDQLLQHPSPRQKQIIIIRILHILLATTKPDPDIFSCFHTIRVDPLNSGYMITSLSRPDTRRICLYYLKGSSPSMGNNWICVCIHWIVHKRATRRWHTILSKPFVPQKHATQPRHTILFYYVYKSFIYTRISGSAPTAATSVLIKLYVEWGHRFHTTEIIGRASIVCWTYFIPCSVFSFPIK